MSIPKVLLIIHKKNRRGIISDLDIILEDGSAAYLYEKENGAGLVLYQNRINAPIAAYDEIWEKLSKGKAYYKDFAEIPEILDDMIHDAIEWLWFPNQGFSISQILDKDAPHLCENINTFI